MTENMAVKKIGNNYFVYIKLDESCEECGKDVPCSGWHQIEGDLGKLLENYFQELSNTSVKENVKRKKINTETN